MNEMNICNNENLEQVAKATEEVAKNKGTNSVILVAAGAVGAMVVSKLCNWGWNAIKNRMSKRNENPEPSDDDITEDLPPIEDPGE